MNAKFISVTQTTLKGSDGVTLTPEELIVYIARVSNPNNQSNTSTAEKLLGYCIKKKHWSPFDMVNLCVEVKTSKAIAIQILRHWSIKPQEFSQRYAEVTDMEPVELRKSGSTNRQSSTEVFDPVLTDMDMGELTASAIIDDYIQRGQAIYTSLITHDVAKECARMVLPMTTQTTMYLNGSVRSWIHYLQQRLDPHAQLEHRELAKLIESIFSENFPATYTAVQIVKAARVALDTLLTELKSRMRSMDIGTTNDNEIADAIGLIEDFEFAHLDKI
jgi:thymidylate synthase (FAD)